MQDGIKMDEKWVNYSNLAYNKIGGTWNFLDENLKGELTYDKNNGSIILELFKILESPKKYLIKFLNIEEIPFIIGTTNDHRTCILKDCELIKSKLFNNDFQIYIKAKILFIDYPKKTKRIVFNEINFRLTNSLLWANGNLFKFLDTENDNINLIYETEKRKFIKIDDNTKIVIIPTNECSKIDTNKENILLSQYVIISIRKEKAASYEEFLNDIEKVINLITFATNKKVNIYNLVGYSENNFREYPDGEKVYYPIEIIDHRMQRLEDDNNIISNDPLFDLNDMIKNNNLKIWFNKYNELQNIIKLLLLNVKNEVPLEIHFCNLMQALELIHRTNFKRKNKFINHLKEKFANNDLILNNIIDHKDQIDCPYIILRSRLIDLLDNNFLLFKENINKDNIIILADILTNSRNYYTHYNESKKEKCIKGKNLKYAINLLEYLITALILQELNFSLEDIDNMLEDKTNYISRYQMIKRICDSKN